jgi:hypothetical protein
VEFVLYRGIFVVRNVVESNQKTPASLIPLLSHGVAFMSRSTTSCFKTRRHDNEIMKSYDHFQKLHNYNKFGTDLEPNDDVYAAPIMCGRFIPL